MAAKPIVALVDLSVSAATVATILQYYSLLSGMATVQQYFPTLITLTSGIATSVSLPAATAGPIQPISHCKPHCLLAAATTSYVLATTAIKAIGSD